MDAMLNKHEKALHDVACILIYDKRVWLHEECQQAYLIQCCVEWLRNGGSGGMANSLFVFVLQ